MPLSKAEAASARSQLKLRTRPDGVKQVYATVHGTYVYRWFLISDSTYEWYVKRFNPPVIPYNESER